jgi:hypothetical protein
MSRDCQNCDWQFSITSQIIEKLLKAGLRSLTSYRGKLFRSNNKGCYEMVVRMPAGLLCLAVDRIGQRLLASFLGSPTNRLKSSVVCWESVLRGKRSSLRVPHSKSENITDSNACIPSFLSA